MPGFAHIFGKFNQAWQRTWRWHDGVVEVSTKSIPAFQLDLALIHMNRADAAGNGQFLGPDIYFDDLFAMAADRTIMSCERIVPTDAKAKELRRVTERLITKAKRLGAAAHTPQSELSDTDKARRLHVHRQLSAFLPRFGVERDGFTKRDLVEKVLVDLTKRYAERAGGYTRIIKIGARRGDNAAMSLIELVDAPPVEALEVDDADEAAEETAEAADEAAADDGDAEDAGDDAADADDAGDHR